MMNPHNESDTSAHELPLTEMPTPASLRDRLSEEDIRTLVDAFYATVRSDDLLGPIFEERVRDWSAHLPKMYDFWSTIILHTGRYSGRPLEVHERISGLTPAHFARWLALWEQTVAVTIPPDRGAATRDAFTIAARRMAESMSARLIT